MKNFASRLLLAFFLLVPVAAFAQSTGTVVVDCTTGVGLAYTPGSTRPMTLLPSGKACVDAAVSVSGFAPATTGTPISVTTGGVTGTLPAGSVVIATNVGATNAAYCKLGASATTSDQYIAPNGGWFAFTVGAATQLTCITSTSTTTVNMVGGAGIATGTGGGGGSGGGGAVTVADGADVTQGAVADAAATAGSTGTLSAKLRYMTTQLDNINTNIQAGSGATGSAAPASAIYAGGISRSSEPSATSTGNLFGDFNDLVGKRVTSPYANRENMVRGSASATGTGATTIIAASGSASLKTYVTDIECGRTDAGTTAIFVTLNDVGGTGSGTVLLIPAGGGNNKSFNVPLVTAANTAFTFTASSGVTTLYCSAQGFTGY